MPNPSKYPSAPTETQQWLMEGKLIEFPATSPAGVSPEEWKLLRTVRADWLQSLFNSETGICVQPVRIRNAIVEGELRLRNRTAKYTFEITDSVFDGLADFSFFSFDGSADFQRSRFKEGARFNSARFRYDLRLNEAAFMKESAFQAIEVTGRIFALGVHLENAHFASARFLKSAVFKSRVEAGQPSIRTEFVGDAKFPDARFESSVEFDGATFSGKVDFSRTVLAANASFGPARAGGTEALRTEFCGEALFRDMNVMGGADFRGAQFAKDASFQQVKVGANWLFNSLGTDSGFLRTTFGGAARFDGVQAGARITFEGAQFLSDCSFEAARVRGNFLFRGLRGADLPIEVGGGANFLDVEIGGTADFNGGKYAGQAVFRRMTIGGSAFLNAIAGKSQPLVPTFSAGLICDDLSTRGSLFAQGAIFGSETSFRRIQVGNNGFFGFAIVNDECLSTIFEENANFADAQFAGGLNASGIHFKKNVSFDRLQVGGVLYFGPAETEDRVVGSRFEGDVSWMYANLEGRADLPGTEFDGAVNFTGTKFGGGASFSSLFRHGITLMTRFKGARLRMYRCEFDGDLDLSGCEFHPLADLEAVRVKGNAICRTSLLSTIAALPTFRGGARFMDASIDGAADFSGAVFMQKASFAGMKVGGPAFFRRSTDSRATMLPSFEEVSFEGAVFSGGADFDRVDFSSGINFTGATFGALTRFTRIRCKGKASFDSMEVDGTANFQQSQFSDEVSLQDARIGTVNFGTSQADSGLFLKSVDLRGFTYSRLVGDWRELFHHVSSTDPQPYAQLEKYFRSVGNERDADSVYLARRKIERGNLLRQSKHMRLVEDSLLRWIFNYGVPSYRMLWLACALFLVGALLLSRPGALESTNNPKLQINGPFPRLFYGSVVLGDNLLHRAPEQALTQWTPSDQKCFGSLGPTYRQVTSLVGLSVYASLTLAIASLTGLIKRKPA
jgi:hypothetical protein